MLLATLACFGLVLALLLTGTRSIAAPSTLYTACWTLLLLLTWVFGGPYVLHPSTLLLVSALAGCFLLGCLVASAAGTRGRSTPRLPRGMGVGSGVTDQRDVPRIPAKLVFGCALVGVLGAGIVSKELGHSLLSFHSVTDLFAASQTNAQQIFRGEKGIPALGKVCFAILQLGFLLSGARGGWSPRRRQAWEWAALLVAAMLWSVVTTQRSYLLVPLVWWASGALAAAVYAGRARRLLNARTALVGAVGAFVLAAVVLGLRFVRTGDSASQGLQGVVDSSRPWLAGYLPALSSSLDDRSASSGGGASALLVGAKALIGQGGPKVFGGYEFIGNGDTSNASTMIPFLVSAAGLVGAGIVMLVLGWIAGRSYELAQAGSLGGTVLYAVSTAGILWSPNSWFYGYGGRILTIIAVLLLLAWHSARRTRQPGSGGAEPLGVGAPAEVGKGKVPTAT